MNIHRTCKLILLSFFALMLAISSTAMADDINPDADVPDISTADATPANPVLEIPQQCDQDSVAVLCDRSADGGAAVADATAATSSGDADSSNQVASNPDLGSVYDYANQNITSEASATGTMNVPLGVGVMGYPALAPAPVVVSSGPNPYVGPGAYQQWVSGPGTWQPRMPGPGFLSYHPFGMSGGFGGGHFGRR